jgi:hypothetical protein
MIRPLLVLLGSLCTTAAWGQVPIYPAYAQPPALSAYPPFYGAAAPYGFGGYGVGGYGFGGYGIGGVGLGGFGYPGLGFGAVGYGPLVGYGNLNWLPPNRPSPYYVVPSGREYLDQVQQRDRTTYAEMILRHNAGQ